MRKIFLIAFFCQFLIAKAQLKIGVEAGINFSNSRIKNVESSITGNQTFISQLNGGFLFEIPLEENWLLYSGLHYNEKGYIVRAKRPEYNLDTFTYRLNYLELPFSAGYRVSPKLSINSGIYLGYGFNGTKTYNRNIPSPEKHLHKKDQEFKRLDFGYKSGILFQAFDNIGIKLDYSKSIFDVTKNPLFKERNFVYQFSIFWFLNNKKDVSE